MSKTETQTRIQTPMFRADFVKIWEPETKRDEKTGEIIGKPKYSLVAIFEKDADLKAMIELAQSTKANSALKGRDDVRSPFRYGFKEKAGGDDIGFAKPHNIGSYPQYKDKITADLGSFGRQPGVIGTVKGDDGKFLQLTDKEKGKLYSGCYCRASIVGYAQTGKGNDGIRFSLQNIQVLKDGPPLGGGVPAENEFDAEKFDPAMYGIDNSAEMTDMDDM